MAHDVTFRMGAALVALAFAVTSGRTGMQEHPRSAHATSGHDIASEAYAPEVPPAPAHASHAAAASEPAPAPAADEGHAEHPAHGSSDECACVGPCQSGAPPTLTVATFTAVEDLSSRPVRVVRGSPRLIAQDPRSRLLPFPNAPPARV